MSAARERVETERLVLRRPALADLDAVHRIHSDPRTYELASVEPHRDREQSEEMLRRWLTQWERDGIAYWAVEREGAVVGFGGVSLLHGFGGRDVLNVYYRFAPEAWGRGYATELVRAAIALARRELPELPLVARVFPGNEPSMRVAERAGLERRPDLDDGTFEIFALGWTPE